MPDVKNTLQSYSAELENKNIEVVEHKCTRNLDGQKCTTCVLGVLLSDHGKQIEQYMLSWLTKKYNVISVRQPLPGSLFEYPALRYAQLYSIERNEPVLYLHTKGAANPRAFQKKTINLWKHEFVKSKQEYENHLDEYDLLLPYSGPQNITWFNGFIATSKAYSAIPQIPIFENRFYYETLFKGSSLKCYGRRFTGIVRTDTEDSTNLIYRDVNHFSSSFSPVNGFFHDLWASVYPCLKNASRKEVTQDTDAE